MANESESLSAKLRALRAKRDLTQAQVAQILGISQQTYSNYENKGAAIDSKTLKAICELYGVSADYLLGISQAPESGVEDMAYMQSDEKFMSLFKDFYKKVTRNENKGEGSTDDNL